MYSYLVGRSGYGIGVENLALRQPTTLPVDSIYAPKYNIQNSLAPQSPGFVKMYQNFVPVSLLANGVYFSGALALQALSDFEKDTTR